MPLTILPETEARLHKAAAHRGLDVDALLSALLDDAEREQAEEIAAVRRGLADVAAGRTRSFDEFLSEHKRRYPPQAEPMPNPE